MEILKNGKMEIWKYGNLKIWKYGNIENNVQMCYRDMEE